MRKTIIAVAVLLLRAGCSSDKQETLSAPTPDTMQTVEPSEQGKPSEPIAADTGNAAEESEAQPEPEESAESGPEPLPLEGHIICIDPGHCVTPLTGKGYTELVSPLSDERKTLYNTGTRGKNLTEEKLNLAVGLKLRDALESLGATVVMTREVSEITITGIERCEIAHKANAEVNIHIHADGNNDHSVHGVSVLVPAGDLLGTPSIKDESVRLGKLMVDAVAEATGAKNLGTIDRTDLTGFNFSEIPTVLIEMGFMTNPDEDAKLETEEYQDKIVEGMIASVLAWYDIHI